MLQARHHHLCLVPWGSATVVSPGAQSQSRRTRSAGTPDFLFHLHPHAGLDAARADPAPSSMLSGEQRSGNMTEIDEAAVLSHGKALAAQDGFTWDQDGFTWDIDFSGPRGGRT